MKRGLYFISPRLHLQIPVACRLAVRQTFHTESFQHGVPAGAQLLTVCSFLLSCVYWLKTWSKIFKGKLSFCSFVCLFILRLKMSWRKTSVLCICCFFSSEKNFFRYWFRALASMYLFFFLVSFLVQMWEDFINELWIFGNSTEELLFCRKHLYKHKWMA